MTFDPYKHSIVEVTDADGNVLHTWMHIPRQHVFSSALGEDMILPCDEAVVFEMHSAPSDDSNPNYIGVQHSFWLPEWGVKEDLVPGIRGRHLHDHHRRRPWHLPHPLCRVLRQPALHDDRSSQDRRC